ncbi:MAG: chemotaxis protein CheA [Bacteroidota bacterium]|nr:chemotaxis protein CheA [Bacteroidota bacterium]MDP4272847.1 chemotaxis protein CheA [Bacteroidota bacterium]
MENFKEKFKEEAIENINDLEKALLELESSPQDKELIERVFRAMHSLKGGGAMFGYANISEYTHNLETVYDRVRNDQMKIDENLLNITFASVDLLKKFLNEEDQDPEVIKEKNFLSGEINALINGQPIPNQPVSLQPFASEEKNKSLKTFYVLFIPEENIFDNGTNPLFLLDELGSLSNDFVVYPHVNKVPGLEKINPESCYIYWEIYLSTEADMNAITDVFIFVEDECVLQVNKISEVNLLQNKEFLNKIDKTYKDQVDADVNELTKFAYNLSQASVEEKKKAEEKPGINVKERAISSIRVASDKLDNLMNLVSELVTVQARLDLYAANSEDAELLAIAENIQKLSRQMRDIAFSIVLIPIETMLTRFQRLIRDLSNELNKEVIFVTEGVETELDKTIIENLLDPFMHIFRNSLDHGIESAEKRIALGKPAKGKIMLKAFYSGANVFIQISDDGAGIDPEVIREKAIRKGFISQDAQLSKKELIDMIFLPGFSTSDKVTDVSGRGVGMDVVKRKISDIRGEVEVESEVNVGTTITIKLPLTLSIIDGLLVKIQDTFYVIPLSVVNKIYAAPHKDLVNTFNHLVVLDGRQIPFYYLREELGVEENQTQMEEVVAVKYEDREIGLVVDSVEGEYQAVLKPLGKHYKKQDFFSGATILGNGTLALVMDTNKAIKRFSIQ